MKRRHLYLTGYRGCGKSTTAERLSQHLGLPLCDLDEQIEATAGKPIAEIFASEGEAGFRDREITALAAAAEQGQQVIALGGGAILRQQNRETISHTGWCVWLDADPAIIGQRLAGDQTTRLRRPSLTALPAAEEIVAVMQTRAPLYQQVADLRIDTTSESIEKIVEQIVNEFYSE